MADAFADAPYTSMSPTLLAEQPLTTTAQRGKEDRSWGAVFSHLEARLGFLRAWRYSWWSHWARLAEFFLPRRYHWLVVANKMSRGNPINDQIVDSTGTLAVETCASGMWAGLTNPSRPWLKFGISMPGVELDADAKEWLEDAEERVYTVLAQSNFYTEMAQAFEDLTVFGTAPFIIYEDFEDVIRVYLPCAGEYYLATGARFEVDTLYREFVLTVVQLIEMFGADNCPPQVTKLWQAGGASLDNEFVVAHSIEPNFAISKREDTGEEVKVVPGKFTYREIYWLKGQKTDKPLSKRGFHEKPFMAMRWSKVSNDPYGRSPCMDALGDTKQIQVETRRKAEFIEKGVRPPMGANPELKNEPSSIIPGMITYMNTDGGKKGFWPLFEPQPAWLNGITADIEKVSARIEKCLFVDVFMAITQMQGVQPRNELELTKRDLERLQKLGPVINLVENELSLAIRRVMAILERRKMLNPMPPSLKGIPLKIEFVSLMRLAQRAAGSVSMKDFFVTAGELSAASKAAGVPDPLRKVNLDKALEKYGDLVNFPSECLFTDKEVEQHDQAREQAKAAAQAPGAAMAGVTAAKTLSETPLQNGSALSALLGTPAGQA
ncbi:hypothetical protein FHT86_002161 [Rhizobium sp. BK313]|uniref:portal protein n=1 Tax=Rhizobium sp. BK313 TaxID=2587081 RepID=UPI00161C8022|nr:portal protein [Rhizobium sp. BK313]MBB3453905.1 hypothetical protein [Rhizobium sp. BK313]